MMEGSKIKIYTERSWLPERKTAVTLLFPFWGNPETDTNDPDHGRFDEYCKSGTDFFTLVDSGAEADVFLMPFEFSFETKLYKKAIELSQQAEKMKKKILIFFNSDLQDEILVPNAIIFRTSFCRSTRKKNEFAIPGWSADFMKKEMKAYNEEKPVKASVSYCGYVDFMNWGDALYWSTLWKNTTGKISAMHQIGPRLRGKLVRKLLRDKRVETNFIIRKGFWALGMNRNDARKQYIGNMMGSDYALVTRGGGNFSYRLYEVLSCGKIPVFVDTDCVLPFDRQIDWKSYMVWVNEEEMGEVAENLVSFHDKLSKEEFLQLKKKCRALYEEYISPTGFFKNLHTCIEFS